MEYQLKHPKTFRYQILNENETATTILYALHGYGQLAEFFIRKFREIDENIIVVAPEGMHRFYLKGSSGRVGASWMTKEAREADITDNLSFLDALDETLANRFNIKKRYLLGFSQGGATAARWHQMGSPKFGGLILWASVYPPDLQPILSNDSSSSKNYFVIGNEDEFYPEIEQQRLIDEYTSHNYIIKRYAGQHDIVNNTLTEILDELSRN